MGSQETAASGLSGLGVLFSASWEAFLSRWGVLMAVAAASSIGMIAGGLAPFLVVVPLWGFFPHYLLLGAAAAAGLFTAFWLASWGQVAMFEAVLAEPALDFRGCLRASRGKVGPFSWVYILFIFLVFSGMCLLIVPGVFLAAALAFSPFVCIEEGLPGFKAMEKSLYYVRGRWFEVFLRLILTGTVAFLPSMIPWIGWILSLLLAPWALVLMAGIYRDLRRSREGAEPFVPSARTRLLLSGALLGLAIPLFGAVSLFNAVRRHLPEIQARMETFSQRGMDPATGQKWLRALEQAGGVSPDDLRGISP